MNEGDTNNYVISLQVYEFYIHLCTYEYISGNCMLLVFFYSSKKHKEFKLFVFTKASFNISFIKS